LGRFFQLTGAEIVAVTPQRRKSLSTRFAGFGRASPEPNIGDCFSYALADDDHALLSRRRFSRTDIRPALS